MSTHHHSDEKQGAGASCGHDHGPGETCGHHAKESAPGHEHKHHDGYCGHDHSHAHKHEHGASCGHDHSHGHAAAADPGDKEWTRRFLLFLELLVLMIWAVVLLYFYASGRIGWFLVTPMFQKLALFGGLGLAVLGLFNWAMRASNAGCGHDHGDGGGCCGHDHDHDHEHEHEHEHGRGDGHSHASKEEDEAGHGHGPVQAAKEGGHEHEHAAEEHHHHHHHHEGGLASRAFGLIVLAFPIAAAAALTPNDFSPNYHKMRVDAAGTGAPNTAAMRKRFGVADAQKTMGGYTIDVFNRVTTRNQKGEYELRVEFLSDFAGDPEVRNVVKGIPIETSGMLMKDKVNNPDGKRLRAAVMISSCCATDGRIYSVPVEFDGPAPNVEEMTWYKVTGTIDFGTERGSPVTIIKKPQITPTTRPPLFRSTL